MIFLQMCGESPEQYMDDSIRSVESDKGHDDNSPYNNDPEDKLGNGKYSFLLDFFMHARFFS